MDPQLRQSASFISAQLQSSNYVQLPHPFTFESQENSCSNIQLTEYDRATDHTECKLQLEKQYKLKIQSLTKQYEVKLARERQTSELKEKNYQEEIINLKIQLRDAINIKADKKEENSSYCSICSNGQVLNHMKNMLQSLQDAHRSCLSQKQLYTDQICTLQQRVNVLEQQCNMTEEKCKKSKQQIRQLKQQIETHERQKRQRERIYREKQRSCQVKEIQLEEEIARARALEKELEKEFQMIKVQKGKETIDIDVQEQENHTFRKSIDYQDKPFGRQETIGQQLSRNASYLQPTNLNQCQTKANWKTKMSETYNDYAGYKRQNSKFKNNYERNSELESLKGYGKFSYLD